MAEARDVEVISSVQDTTSAIAKSDCSESYTATSLASSEGAEAIRDFNVSSKERLPFIFRLMRVQGIPAWANSSSVTIDNVVQGNVLFALLSNYMVDIDWLMSACPDLRKIPHVLIVHGESGTTVEHLKRNKPANWRLHKPPLPISYGTHHSKAMLLVYSTGVRVVVHTANLIYVDWNNKTQGLWMQDFPWKDKNSLNKGCFFENDLVDYLSMLKWPDFGITLPGIGNVNINASFFKMFDYGSAVVRLIASVPGYHMGPNLKKWGHMKLRSVLEGFMFDKEFYKSPLVYQGYSAGNAIPSPQKNVEKDFLKMYWARWKADHVGRCRAMPHIKSYTRYNGQNLAWFLLTSANLSKAAWGSLQKNNSQLMLRSYELGVLFLPSMIQNHGPVFSCTGSHGLKQDESKPSGENRSIQTKLATLCFKGSKNVIQSSEVIQMPVPYQLPPQPYTSGDVPWSWDRRYTKEDVYGRTWPPQG